jgi:hypothetical protein
MMEMAPTVAHFVWLPAPRGGRIFAWGGPARKLAPTLRSCTWLRALRAVLIALGIAWLAACGSNAPAPDWQINAHGALQGYTAAYLSGNSKVADLEFARARHEMAATGRPDQVSRAEATRCAVQVASLVLDDCAGLNALGRDAAAADAAYGDYLAGHWQALADTRLALLSEHHRAMLASKDDGARVATLAAMADPVARLVAAGALFRQGLLPPAGIELAVGTASGQGWRRPLLAWLGVQLRLAEAGGDAEARAKIQRRIDLANAKPLEIGK